MVPYADTHRIQEVHESIEKSHNSEAGTKRAISRAQSKMKERNVVTVEDAHNDHFEDNRYKNNESNDLNDSNYGNFEFNSFINECELDNEDENIKLFTSVVDKKIDDNIVGARNFQKRKQIIFESMDESERNLKPKVYVPYQSDEELGKSL
jgi:hypothetical protein